MKTHRFTKTINVAGTKFSAGDEIAKHDIPAGHFESCVRLGDLVEIPKEVQLREAMRIEPLPIAKEEALPVQAEAKETPPAPVIEDGDDPDATPQEMAKIKQQPTKKNK